MKWRWSSLQPVQEVAKQGLDADRRFGEVKIDWNQLWSPHELDDGTSANSQRRRRDIVQNFKRRYFTNDPQKAPTHPLPPHELSAVPPAMRRSTRFENH